MKHRVQLLLLLILLLLLQLLLQVLLQKWQYVVFARFMSYRLQTAV